MSLLLLFNSSGTGSVALSGKSVALASGRAGVGAKTTLMAQGAALARGSAAGNFRAPLSAASSPRTVGQAFPRLMTALSARSLASARGQAQIRAAAPLTALSASSGARVHGRANLSLSLHLSASGQMRGSPNMAVFSLKGSNELGTIVSGTFSFYLVSSGDLAICAISSGDFN